MTELYRQVIASCRTVDEWFRARAYRGNDPYQLDESIFKYRWIPLLSQLRALARPLHSLIPKRAFTSRPPILISKALGLILSGHAYLHRIDPDPVRLQECRHLLSLLEKTRNTAYAHHCWGWPFEWGSRIRYPYNTPLVCVTSPIAHGILDYYGISQDQDALAMVNDISEYLMHENGYRDFGASLCLYYSPSNVDLAYNSNIMAASLLLRLARITGEEKPFQFAQKAIQFVVEGQNDDGSWYYTDSRGDNDTDTVIDHRHTGFVLEHLHISAELLQSQQLDRAIERGWEFYREKLFQGVVPRWGPKRTYPVDVHDVAQAIITAVAAGRADFSDQIVAWAMDRFFNGRDGFYYKLFENGRVNQTVFIRWNQAWMYKALASWAHRAEQQHAATG